MLAYLAAAALFYFSYGLHHSVGANGGWDQYMNNTMMQPVIHSHDDMEVDENAYLTSWAQPPPLFNQPNIRRSSENLKSKPQLA